VILQASKTEERKNLRCLEQKIYLALELVVAAVVVFLYGPERGSCMQPKEQPAYVSHVQNQDMVEAHGCRFYCRRA
jgi:hypothetical protein